MDMPFTQAEVYLSKLTISHYFGTLNTRIGNQNVLKRILIAMHNKNKADCNENFRPFPYEGSISKFRDQIDVSPNFLDSRFRQNVDYKLRFEVLLARPLGFPCHQEGISKFLKNEIEVSPHPHQDSLNW